MRPHGRPGELFAAFSRITATAFVDDRLLSCPTLSKAPNYGDVLRRYLSGAPHTPLSGLSSVRAALRYLCANTAHLMFLLMIRLFILLLRWRLPPALVDPEQRRNDRRLVIIDSFAVLPRLAGTGRFEELYLPGLFEEARAVGYIPLRLYRLYGSRNPLILWKALRALAQHGDGMTEAHLFTLKDWLLLCRHVLVYPLALRKLSRSLAPMDSHLPEAYIRTALNHTMGQCILPGEARRLAAHRLGKRLAERFWNQDAAGEPKIISWYENQTINKAFQRGLAQAERTTGRHVRVVGAQLFTWPANLLNNHPDDGEADLGLAPDVVAVNGPWFLPEQSRQAYTVGPAVRYKSLFEPPAEGSAVPKGDRLLALLSYHPEETRRVLELVLPLASAKGGVAYKFHPATRPEEYAAWLPPSPDIVTEDLSCAVRKSRAVIGSGSGSLLEAAALGVPALAVEDPAGPDFGLNYFPQEGADCGKNELWTPVRSASEVEDALNRLCAQQADAATYARKARAFRNLVFAEPTREGLRRLLEL
jgi:hypothetical protein